MSFRDRFFTPKVYRALWSPVSLGLLVAVSVGTALLGVPVIAAIGLGVVTYAAKVLFAVPRAERTRRVDPFVLKEPWRRYVQGALSAKGRFDRTVGATHRGPIRDRLTELASRLDAAVEESWRIASRGHEIDAALGRLDVGKAMTELERLRSLPAASPEQDAAIRSLETTVASGRRMQEVSASTRQRLDLLDTRLDELVARAAEVSIGAADTRVLGNDVDDLVTSLESLRLAIEEVNSAASPAVPFDRPVEQPGLAGSPLTAPAERPADEPVQKPRTRPPG